MIAALYVETDGCYFGLPDVDPWDEIRDARKYAGPWPVVAHPPCQRWGKLWAGQPLFIKQTGIRKVKGDDGGCFAAALASTRAHGGVIEHPWQSHAWPHFGLAVPSRKGGWIVADAHGGWTCCVEQGRYGHYARKPTLLYANGLDQDDLPELEWGESAMKLDPAVVARMGLKRAKRLGEVGARGGGQNSTPRIHTPAPFRDLLLSIAKTVKKRQLTPNKQEHIPASYPAQTTEKTKMEIRIEIVADSVDEYHDTLRRLLAGVAPVTPVKSEDNVVATPNKGRPRKAVDNTTKSEPEPEEKQSEPEQTADTPQDEVDELAGQIEETPPEPPKVVLTNNNVKALAIRYINDAVVGDAAKDPSIQDGRRKLFGEIIDSTGVTDRKFSSIPDDKLEDVVAYITKQRADKKLKADEVRD